MNDSYSSSLPQMSERSDHIHVSLKEGWLSLTTPKAYRRWILRHFYQLQNTQLLPSWCNTGKTEVHKGGDGPLLPTIHWTPPVHPHRPPPALHQFQDCVLLQVYLNLNSKELHSLWARGSQIHFPLQWPSGSLAPSRPPPLESLHRFVPYKAVLLLLLSTEGKGEPSHLGLLHNGSPWKESFGSKTQVAPEIFQNPSCFPFWKIFSEISKSSLTVDQTLVIGPKGLFHCVPKIVYLD